MKKQLASILIATCAVATGVCAQEVYRCGNSYGGDPCTNATALDAQDNRTAEQQAQATESFRREARLAKKLEKERLQREAQERVVLRKYHTKRPTALKKAVIQIQKIKRIHRTKQR